MTNKKSSFDREYKRYKDKIEKTLVEICDGCINMPTILVDAIKYSILSGGKRLRPILCLATVQMLGGTLSKRVIKLACIIEIIHCFSLVHDDLPCMDDDDYRRGKLSTHKLFGEAMGVLAGDAILNLAYEIGISLALENKNIALAVQFISANAGGMGLVGGQVEDIRLEDTKDSGQLEYIYLCKTAAMFCASFASAALAIGAKSVIKSKLDKLGSCFGYAFQIKDDLDEYYNGGISQKSKDKMTVVSVYGDKRAHELLNEQIQECIKILDELNESFDTSFLRQIVNKLK